MTLKIHEINIELHIAHSIASNWSSFGLLMVPSMNPNLILAFKEFLIAFCDVS